MDYSEHLEQIAAQGYTVIDSFLPAGITTELSTEIYALKKADVMKQAGISQQAMVNSSIRGDFIHWLEIDNCSTAQHSYLDKMDELRQLFNQTFFLSLNEFECHLAAYPTGSSYQKHLDQFKGNQHRKITAILYLNQDWSEHDGGALRLYLDGESDEPFLDIMPNVGRLLIFESARFWHEVLPARRERLSITGWYRTRSDLI